MCALPIVLPTSVPHVLITAVSFIAQFQVQFQVFWTSLDEQLMLKDTICQLRPQSES